MTVYDPINFDKIVSIQLNKWRQLREEKFKKLDIEFMKALEIGDEEAKSSIVRLKNELRDITNFDFSSLDIKDIVNYYPDCLT
jgi:hypothetical protein